MMFQFLASVEKQNQAAHKIKTRCTHQENALWKAAKLEQLEGIHLKVSTTIVESSQEETNEFGFHPAASLHLFGRERHSTHLPLLAIVAGIKQDRIAFA
jgi:hypothetical protein